MALTKQQLAGILAEKAKQGGMAPKPAMAAPMTKPMGMPANTNPNILAAKPMAPRPAGQFPMLNKQISLKGPTTPMGYADGGEVQSTFTEMIKTPAPTAARTMQYADGGMLPDNQQPNRLNTMPLGQMAEQTTTTQPSAPPASPIMSGNPQLPKYSQGGTTAPKERALEAEEKREKFPALLKSLKKDQWEPK
jgi:hypothetical protein